MKKTCIPKYKCHNLQQQAQLKWQHFVQQVIGDSYIEARSNYQHGLNCEQIFVQLQVGNIGKWANHMEVAIAIASIDCVQIFVQVTNAHRANCQ